MPLKKKKAARIFGTHVIRTYIRQPFFKKDQYTCFFAKLFCFIINVNAIIILKGVV